MYPGLMSVPTLHPRLSWTVPLLTWQPAACSCGYAVPQGQHAVGIGTQQLPSLETQSHKHNQSPEPGARLLLGKEEMFLGVLLRPEPSFELLIPWPRSTLPLGMPSLVSLLSSSFTSITLSSMCILESKSRVTNLQGRGMYSYHHLLIMSKYWPVPHPQP